MRIALPGLLIASTVVASLSEPVPWGVGEGDDRRGDLCPHGRS